MWQELQDQFGEGLFPDSIANPSDQLIHLEDTLQNLKPLYENPFQTDWRLTLEQVKNDILNTMVSDQIRQTPKTKADKVAEKAAAEAREESTISYYYEEKMDMLISEGRLREQRRIDRAHENETRRKIYNITDKFRRMALKPGKGATQHASPELLKSVVRFADAVNDSEIQRQQRWAADLDRRTEAAISKMQKEGEYPSKKLQEEFQKIETSGERNAKALMRLMELKNAYSSMKDSDLSYDETVAEMVDDLTKHLTDTLAKGDLRQLALAEVFAGLALVDGGEVVGALGPVFAGKNNLVGVHCVPSCRCCVLFS